MKILFFLILAYSQLFSKAQQINSSLVYSVSLPTIPVKKPAVLVLLHGYGSNESDLFSLSNQADSRFLVFSLRALVPVTKAGFAWYPMDFLADKQFRYDYTYVIQAKQQILSFISSACKAYGADSNKVFLLGFSQGAAMAYDIALTSPEKISGILALSGRILEESKRFSKQAQKLEKLHFFIAHGLKDAVIDVKETEKAGNFLKSHKLNQFSIKYYNMAHNISAEELTDIRIWLSQFKL
jgi:phospholipase/carboxylesterase